MATILQTGHFITITAIAADVLPAAIFKGNEDRLVKRIEFVAGAGNDICVIKQKTDAGATIATLATPDVEIIDRVYFEDGGQFMSPMIDISDCTLNAGHKLVIELK